MSSPVRADRLDKDKRSHAFYPVLFYDFIQQMILDKDAMKTRNCESPVVIPDSTAHRWGGEPVSGD
jgi:hypothetical protein